MTIFALSFVFQNSYESCIEGEPRELETDQHTPGTTLWFQFTVGKSVASRPVIFPKLTLVTDVGNRPR